MGAPVSAMTTETDLVAERRNDRFRNDRFMWTSPLCDNARLPVAGGSRRRPVVPRVSNFQESWVTSHRATDMAVAASPRVTSPRQLYYGMNCSTPDISSWQFQFRAAVAMASHFAAAAVARHLPRAWTYSGRLWNLGLAPRDAARLVGQRRLDGSPFLVEEFVAHDSAPSVRRSN